MRVFKFLSKKFALDNLTKHRIKISEYSDMNDPFELRGAVLSDPELQNQLTQLIRSTRGPMLQQELEKSDALEPLR
jgi:hypothetical protein